MRRMSAFAMRASARGENAELFEGAATGPIDREVGRVHAVAKRQIRTVFPKFRENGRKERFLADVAARASRSGQIKDARIEGNDRDRETHFPGVRERALRFGGRDVRARHVVEKGREARFLRREGEKAAVEPSGISDRDLARARGASEGVDERGGKFRRHGTSSKR